MLRNIDSRFSQAPMELDLPRSMFNRDHDHKTTFNAGELIPIYWDEVLPGDTFDLNTNYVCRMSTPIFPVMDNAYLETFYFFVPARLVWDHWKELCGENNTSYWTQPTEYNVPQLKLKPGNYSYEKNNQSLTNYGAYPHTLADYFGLPLIMRPNAQGDEDDRPSISVLPFRAYVKCFNDWFRDQNTMAPAYLPTDDLDREIANDTSNELFTDDNEIGNRKFEVAKNTAHIGGYPLYVSKYHDYFTSALPAPQKGPDVNVLGSLSSPFGPYAPVTTISSNSVFMNNYGMRLETVDSQPFDPDATTAYGIGIVPDSGSAGTAYTLDSVATEQYSYEVAPTNLGLSTDATNVSLLVNDIRLAFQIQKLYEKDARGGTRYIEMIKSHFGVDSPDGRLQRSEYLGGSRQPINMSQVVQTSATDTISPQGNTAAFSLTNGTHNSFIKSFTEHGFIIGMACVRTDHTYQQGINRMWNRKRRFDYYYPALANIGEQPIKKSEIVASMSPADQEVFGYQEAWAEYRYHPSIVSGSFRSDYLTSLDSWHYADQFDLEDASNFVISEEFTLENDANVNRTLAVQSDLSSQFIADFYISCNVTRVMPLYSIPGLIDHH